MTYPLIEGPPIASYATQDMASYVDYKELNLKDQSPYNPAVAGLAAFIWHCSHAAVGAEATANSLVASDARHFAATDPSGLHGGIIHAYSATTSLDEMLFVREIVTADCSLTGRYKRVAATLLYCAMTDERIDKPVVAAVPSVQDMPFFEHIGMQRTDDEAARLAYAQSTYAVSTAIVKYYNLEQTEIT